METIILEAKKRSLRGSRNASRLRTSGSVPAVYYGGSVEPAALQIDSRGFRKVFEKAGENTIVQLNIEGKEFPVLVHDVQYDPVLDIVSHVDFLHVDMQKEVTTNVKVVIAGVAPAVKNLGGILDVQKHEIKIKCLPKDLIHSIEVDVSGIVDFHTSVHVKDLKVPSTIKVLDNPEDTVVTATVIKIEEEKPALTAEVAPGAPVAAGAEGASAASASAATAEAAPAKKEAKK